MRILKLTWSLAGIVAMTPALAFPQAGTSPPDDIRTERSEFARWLKEAPSSPFRAMVQVPIGPGIGLGPADSDVPLPGVSPTRIEERSGRLSVVTNGATRPLARDRLAPFGSYQILAAGIPGQSVITVFGSSLKNFHEPAHYPHSSAWSFVVALTPGKPSGPQRLLTADGTEVEAVEVGTVSVPVAGQPASLRVFRIPTQGTEESELEIYFQDGTNDRGTYPAGRFVNLIPRSDGRYRLDFNRARNPFCAYNTVFPCPAPWRGNRIAAAVQAGEQYRSPSP